MAQQFKVSADWMKACGFPHESRTFDIIRTRDFGSRGKFYTVNRDGYEWEVWSIRGELVEESAPAVEVANEYTAIKLNMTSSLSDLLRNLTVARDVVEMLIKHESIAPVNVHSHGPIIGDLIELCRRAETHAKAFQREVQGR